jgi:sulfur carrier protein
MVPILSRLEDGAQGGDNGAMEAPGQILLNGASHPLPEGGTVEALLEAAGFGGRRVAVEVNGDIVPRSRHGAHRLHDGDRVEIVQALGGG